MKKLLSNVRTKEEQKVWLESIKYSDEYKEWMKKEINSDNVFRKVK